MNRLVRDLVAGLIGYLLRYAQENKKSIIAAITQEDDYEDED